MIAMPVPKDTKMSKLTKEIIVLKGEQSNHHHVLAADSKTSAVEIHENPDGTFWCNVLKGTAVLRHLVMPQRTQADHLPIELGVGTWKIGHQREYDEMGDRKVID